MHLNTLSSMRAYLPLVLLVLLLLIALFAPLLAPYDPLVTAPGQHPQQPSNAHFLGTDSLGRDVLSRALYGSRQTLGITALAAAVAILPGALLGLLAGWHANRWPDHLLLALADTLLAFPNLLLALVLLTLTGTGPLQVALAVGLSNLPVYARVTRTAVIRITGEPYIDAARALGVTARGMLWRHVLPNALPALFNFAAVIFSWSLLNGAALVFLGFGGDPSVPDWGAMLNEGRSVFRISPWVALAPGIAITVTVYAVNRLADAWNN